VIVLKGEKKSERVKWAGQRQVSVLKGEKREVNVLNGQEKEK
jgi:hypothetical protein